MLLCPICSVPVLATSEVCESCGAPLVTKEVAESLPANGVELGAGQPTQRSRLRLLLAIPLALFGALFTFFAVLVGTAIGVMLFSVAAIYFALAAGVLFVERPVLHTVLVALGFLAVALAIGLATSSAPW